MAPCYMHEAGDISEIIDSISPHIFRCVSSYPDPYTHSAEFECNTQSCVKIFTISIDLYPFYVDEQIGCELEHFCLTLMLLS